MQLKQKLNQTVEMKQEHGKKDPEWCDLSTRGSRNCRIAIKILSENVKPRESVIASDLQSSFLWLYPYFYHPYFSAHHRVCGPALSHGDLPPRI